MKLKRYAVTIMDGWTPWREFLTYWGARRFYYKHEGRAFLYMWQVTHIRGVQGALIKHEVWKELK